MSKSVHNKIPGPLREFRTASDERAGPGNEAIEGRALFGHSAF